MLRGDLAVIGSCFVRKEKNHLFFPPRIYWAKGVGK